MNVLRVAIPVVWLAFWFYWLVSAVGVKTGSRTGRARLPGLTLVVLLVLLRVTDSGSDVVHDLVLGVVGAIMLASGLGLAVWARVYLGRNWGMPMTRKDEPELVTSGPYRFVRHPIYSGILLGLLGTALALDLYVLIAVAVMGAYFVYSAKVEEALMVEQFPSAYPSYRARTKMMIPFVL